MCIEGRRQSRVVVEAERDDVAWCCGRNCMFGGTDWEVSRSRMAAVGVLRRSGTSISELGVP